MSVIVPITLSPCAISFVEKTLTDIGVTPSQIALVISGLQRSSNVYEQKAPATSPSSIIISLYDCGKNQLNTAVEQIASEVLQFQIVLSVITLIVAMLIILAFTMMSGIYIVIMILFAVIVAAVGIYLLYQNYLSNIRAIAVRLERNVNVCVENSISAINTYDTQQEAAINAALCAY